MLAALCGLNVAPAYSNPTLLVALTPSAPFTKETLTATPIVSGASAEELVYSYSFKVAGVAVQSGPSRTLDLSQTGYGDVGRAVSVEVGASGGTTTLAPGTANVTVANSEPIVDRYTFTK